MSLRGFFMWFWGIVLGSGVAAGATLAVLKAPASPPAPVLPIVQAAISQPLLPPPVPPPVAPRRVAAPWRPAHPTVIRPAPRVRQIARVAERITVVPPIPPEPELRAPVERHVRTAHVAIARRIARAETRTQIVTEEVNPEPPRPRRAYSWYPGYPRYSYDAYAYPYPGNEYPPRFAYFYRY